jgi:hypothetical protein
VEDFSEGNGAREAGSSQSGQSIPPSPRLTGDFLLLTTE